MRIKWKRHFPLVLLLVVLLASLAMGLGSQRIVAYAPQASTDGKVPASQKNNKTVNNKIALFDETQMHSLQILISDDDYQKMITTYQQTGLKDYFKADVVIDGVKVSSVGLRLKGNASLRTALGGGRGGFGGFGGMPGGGNQPPPNGQDRPQRGGGPNQAPVAANPEASAGVKLPMLIKFDEYVASQNYQGYYFLSVRNYGTSYDAAMLQEPVTNSMFRLAGLPATHTAYAGVALNQNPEQLYVLSEILDETYLAEHYNDPKGILYKAEVGSSLTYVGNDPSSYRRSFSQETRVKDADLGPLIAFARFLTESDDATFAAELPKRLDVDAFATFLALNNLLVNNDSIVGMNNNYYLYYNESTKFFTMLFWDANESLGKMGMGSQGATTDININLNQQGFRGPGGGSPNLLLKRFLSNPAFKALYEEKVKLVYQKVYAGGAISEQVNRYAALVHQALASRSLVDTASYDSAVEKVRTFITQRVAYLSATPLLK